MRPDPVTPPNPPAPRRLSAVGFVVQATAALFAFLVTAAPLPGDSPGCENPGAGGDDSPALLGDGPVRTLCGMRCQAECRLLVACGRYATGTGESACILECTGARNCAGLTFEGFCPELQYGPERVITQRENDHCLDIAEDLDAVGCWCPAGQNCWELNPDALFDCTAAGLCDPRE